MHNYEEWDVHLKGTAARVNLDTMFLCAYMRESMHFSFDEFFSLFKITLLWSS